MSEKIKKLINKETIEYVVFGALTTLVNFAVFKLLDMLFESSVSVDMTHVTNVIAWVVAVAFAYVTNKLFVFESKSWEPGLVRKEVFGFAGARLLSLGIEELGLFIFINLCRFDRFELPITGNFSVDGKMLTKIGLSVIVLIMNYIFSKFIIFRKKTDENKEDESA
ncbi:MAG TPA: GtrA family protein [Ruminococcaceae bacterium]|nr:GtrA family protein [Oscillospiraceae bacterium]